MKSTITLFVLFTLVSFTLQCGGRPNATTTTTTTSSTTQPQQEAFPEKEQAQGPTRTPVAFGDYKYGVGNGRGWNQLGNVSKKIFLEGMISGIVATLQRSANELDSSSTKKLNWLMSAGDKHSLSDVMQQIDSFYADSANLNIPVLEAYKYAFFKFEGADQEALNKAISGLRAKYKE